MVGYEERTAKFVAGCVGSGVLVGCATASCALDICAAAAPPAARADDRKKARRFIENQS
jgi:hypothetical protein